MSHFGGLIWLISGALLQIFILLLWSAAYIASSMSELLLLACFLICLIGNYRKRYIFKRAILNRAIVKDSAMESISRGVLTSFIPSLIVSSLSVLSVSYVFLVAEWKMIAYFLLVACLFSVLTWILAGLLLGQMRPPFREATALNWSMFLVGSVFSALYAFWIFNYAPTPEWCDSLNLEAAGTAAFRDLPTGQFTLLNEIFSYYRTIEFISWCAQLPGGAASRFRVFAIVLQSLYTFFGLVLLLASCQMAAMDARAAFFGAEGLEH